MELQLQHLRLQVVHEAIEVVIVNHARASFAKEVQLEGGGHHVASLQSLAIVHIVLLEEIEFVLIGIDGDGITYSLVTPGSSCLGLGKTLPQGEGALRARAPRGLVRRASPSKRR